MSNIHMLLGYVMSPRLRMKRMYCTDFALLRQETGVDFTEYKSGSLLVEFNAEWGDSNQYP